MANNGVNEYDLDQYEAALERAEAECRADECDCQPCLHCEEKNHTFEVSGYCQVCLERLCSDCQDAISEMSPAAVADRGVLCPWCIEAIFTDGMLP